MKYLVTTGTVLRFIDGTQIELTPGVHSFDKHVTEHWAFKAHARAIDDDELKQSQDDQDLALKVSGLETTITGLQQQLDELNDKLAELETGNGKKQSTANK